SPRACMEIAHGIAGPVWADAYEIHRFAGLRRERHAAGLVLRRDRERQARDVRDPRDDVHVDALARAPRAARETERPDERRGERIEMVEPARDEAGRHRRLDAVTARERRLVRRKAGPCAVPRKERAAEADRHRFPSGISRLLALAGNPEDDLIADG